MAFLLYVHFMSWTQHKKIIWKETTIIFFFIWTLGVEPILGPLGTAATPDLLYLLQVIVRMENLMEWTVSTGETEVLGENLPRCHFVHHRSHLLEPGANPGRRGGKPVINRFSYGAAIDNYFYFSASMFVSPFVCSSHYLGVCPLYWFNLVNNWLNMALWGRKMLQLMWY
jgi:hypothetical protein